MKELAPNGYAGVNLTVPHKETAMALVDEVTPEARRIGAINTVFVTPEGRLRATNTDAYGFVTSLKASAPNIDVRRTPAVVLGAGGAARAVCVALQDAGVPEIRIANRTPERATQLASELGKPLRAIPWDRRGELGGVGLLVNTTVLGMTGQAALDIDLTRLAPGTVVNDIVYSPLDTALLKAARARGAVTVDGLGMLLYQAQAGFEGWFGVRPEVTSELRAQIQEPNPIGLNRIWL
jgi:shikimate dehydrogenase